MLFFLLVFMSLVIGYGTTNPTQFGHTATETDVQLSNGSTLNLQKWTEISNVGPKANAFVTATNMVETTSTQFIDIPGMTITTSTGNRPVFIIALVGGAVNTLSGGTVDFQLLVDGVKKDFQSERIGGGEKIAVPLMVFETLSAGSHTIKVQYKASTGGGKARVSQDGQSRSIAVMER